ncbi:MAG: prepilin-type N-terminal cleavage/methylation domain-containing protein, partial [Lachnospiraceae bacterium]|nr:prepilin-type N-terminal cleavage/methylation domain-containing protein [Lachnospiraceae bacterium]
MLKSLKRKFHNALHDDSGASLLELIIAVTILAIVTAPLLNTFVVSAKLNSKARTMGLETNAATSIYEKIKGSNASDIVSSEEDGSVKKEQTEKLGKLFGADSVA